MTGRAHITAETAWCRVPHWAVRDLDAGIRSAHALLVFLVLCDHANSKGTCFPPRRRIASEARCSVKQVDRAIRELESAGVITVERRCEDGRNRPNVYTLEWIADLRNPDYLGDSQSPW